MIDKPGITEVESLYDANSDASARLGGSLARKGIVDSDILSRALVIKGIVDSDIVSKALVIKRHERDIEHLRSNGTGRPSRTLAQVLVEDFRCDHDRIFNEVAHLYAFRTFEIDLESDNTERIEAIKKMINSFDADQKKLMVARQVIPVGYDDKIKDKLMLAA